MGTLNNFDPIFFYLTLGKSATGGAFDGVVTPSGQKQLDWDRNPEILLGQS
jgi:hypothetical protein